MKNNIKTNIPVIGFWFMGVLGIVFLVLKLCGIINWAWFLVLLPSIGFIEMCLLLLIVALITR